MSYTKMLNELLNQITLLIPSEQHQFLALPEIPDAGATIPQETFQSQNIQTLTAGDEQMQNCKSRFCGVQKKNVQTLSSEPSIYNVPRHFQEDLTEKDAVISCV